MKSLGMYLAIGGLGSFILNMMGYEFMLLSWIDNWGTTTGTVIRIAMIIIGGAMFFLIPAEEEIPETEEV